METSCEFGCDGGRFTKVLTDPASWLCTVSARCSKTSSLRHGFLHCGSTCATAALFQASSIDINAFTLSVLMKFLRLSIILYISSYTMALATIILSKGFVAINEVHCKPHRGAEGFDLSCCRRERSVQSHSAWLQPMPQRQDPAASPPDIYVPTPATKPNAAFLRHTLADSNAQVLCTIAERCALTMVATVCDGERSNFL